MPLILPICVVTYQLKPGSASLLAFVSTPNTFVSQAGQLAYTELYFTEILWPDFDRAAFHQALLAYQNRDRRFGTVSTPLSSSAAQAVL